jgi:hypothetical protein
MRRAQENLQTATYQLSVVVKSQHCQACAVNAGCQMVFGFCRFLKRLLQLLEDSRFFNRNSGCFSVEIIRNLQFDYQDLPRAENEKSCCSSSRLNEAPSGVLLMT